MFVDADPSHTVILASTSISLRVFTENKAFLSYEDPSSNLKRSSIKLFDNLKNQIGRLDATICIALLDQGSVEMIKQRQAYRETAIKGARIAHKYAQQDTEEEKVDYNLSVSKPKPVMQEGRLFESK